MLYVFGLISAFAAAWFVLAALQSFADAAPARLTNIALAVVFGVLAVALFWLARRARRAAPTGDDNIDGAGGVRMADPS